MQPEHVHEIQHATRLGFDVPVYIRREGQKALFVRRTLTEPEVRIMDHGGNPPLVCSTCGQEV